MNVLESVTIRSPNEIEEECAHFTITDTEQPFVLNDIVKPDEKYTFSAWVKGSGEISISGNKFPVTADWTKCVITFVSDSTDVEIYFMETGEYYFYNSQLEVGEKDTDYSPAPEDLENRVTDAETVIRVQAGLIEQKVSVNGVISAINQSAEEIKISASKITLEGETIADSFTCTNLTVAGDSKADNLTLVDALYGTYKLDGVIQAEKISKVITFGIGQLLELKVDSYQGNGKWLRMSSTTLGAKELWNYFENSCVFNGKVTIGQALVKGNVNFERNISIYAEAFVSGALYVGSDLTVGGSVIPSVISWYPSSNENFDEVQLRLAGSTGTQGIAFVTYKNGSTVGFYNIISADGSTSLPGDLSVSGKIKNEMTNDSGWGKLALTSQFALYTSGQNVQYRKIGKIVYVRGVVKPTSDIAGSSTTYNICTLPTGYRPSVNEYFVCQGSSKNTWLCTVGTNGNITFSRYGTSSYVTCTTSNWLPFNFTFMID